MITPLPVIYEKPPSDRCSRMDLDPGLSDCPLRDPPGKDIVLLQIQLMRHTVVKDHLKAGIKARTSIFDLIAGSRSRITCISSLM